MSGREERKVVTVLFTDLVGFTSRAEQLDPEDVRALLTPYYARLREQIEQRGGTVEKFIGDAVMAVFGAPVTHEDDPIRAVLAAIAIRDSIHESSPELEIRTAVNTGEALVALDADAAAGEALASGDVVNTAARLQSAAPVNGILVGEATWRATRHVIDYRDAEPVEAKGKAQPVPVWEVVGARSRFGTDVEQTHTSELVGREREIQLLEDALGRCRREQTAQLVTLVGVPGIGKSRLVAELFSTLEAAPDVYWWRQGRSLPYGESRSVWALGEIVKAQAAILETDDAATARDKLAAMLDELLPAAEERRWVDSHLHALAGVGEIDEAGDRRVEAFAAWRRLFEAMAEVRPLVLVFEDLHWADDTLLDFVDHLADWASGVPLLIVCTARPELLDRRADWGGGKRNATTVSIAPLSEVETAQLLAGLLERTVLDAPTQQAVLRRAEGNPLYAAEYARMLADRGDGDLPLPETIQGLIAARIDGLSPEEKALLQDASVLGKVFWPSAVGAPGEELLHALERKEFVRRDRRSAVAGETQYAFLHLLVRDVAYGQIPRARRLEKHRAAAAWIESLSTDRSEDRAEMLAHHYREALRLAEASGADAAPFHAAALAALAEASERAAALGSWAVAGDLAAEAIALARSGEPLLPELQLRLARARTYALAEFDRDLAAAARDGFLARGDVEHAAESEAFLSWMARWVADGDAARAHSERALELAAGLPASVATARVYAHAARLEAVGGDDPARAVALADETLAMAELLLDRDELRSNALNSRGIAKDSLGDPTAVADLARSVELADSANAPTEIAVSRNNYATIVHGQGRIAEAIASLEAARDAALRFGSSNMAQWAAMSLLAHRLPMGGLSAILAEHDELVVQVDSGTQVAHGLAFVRGWVLAVRGEIDAALPLHEESLAGSRQAGERQSIGPALTGKALTLLLGGRFAEADAALDEILADYAPRNSTSDLPFLLAERDRAGDLLPLFAAGADRSEWLRAGAAVLAGELVAAAEIYDAMGAAFPAAWARLLAAERGVAGQLERARAFFATEQATPFVERCDAVLAASA
jgi:class 3 adenylate cyclase